MSTDQNRVMGRWSDICHEQWFLAPLTEGTLAGKELRYARWLSMLDALCARHGVSRRQAIGIIFEIARGEGTTDETCRGLFWPSGEHDDFIQAYKQQVGERWFVAWLASGIQQFRNMVNNSRRRRRLRYVIYRLKNGNVSFMSAVEDTHGLRIEIRPYTEQTNPFDGMRFKLDDPHGRVLLELVPANAGANISERVKHWKSVRDTLTRLDGS